MTPPTDEQLRQAAVIHLTNATVHTTEAGHAVEILDFDGAAARARRAARELEAFADHCDERTRVAIHNRQRRNR